MGAQGAGMCARAPPGGSVTDPWGPALLSCAAPPPPLLCTPLLSCPLPVLSPSPPRPLTPTKLRLVGGRTRADKIWSMPDRTRTISSDVVPKLATFGPGLFESGPDAAQIGQIRFRVGRSRPRSVQLRPMPGQSGPSWAELSPDSRSKPAPHLADLGPILVDVARTWSISDRCRPLSAVLGQSRPGFDSDSAKIQLFPPDWVDVDKDRP